MGGSRDKDGAGDFAGPPPVSLDTATAGPSQGRRPRQIEDDAQFVAPGAAAGPGAAPEPALALARPLTRKVAAETELAPMGVAEAPAFAPRKPAEYKMPTGGLSNAVLFALAGLGLLAVVIVGAKFLRGAHEEATSAPAPAAVSPRTEYRALPAEDAVLITVTATPHNARLLLDGEPLPSNPVRLPRGKTQHKIAAFADGYEATAEIVIPDAPKTVAIRLSKK
jgi:hypothetical protein